MSYLLAFLGFIALIILHEAGHFFAAKATGMRVERFSLFFPPLIFRVRRGETEYALGSLPLGGYVKITGMNPNEELPDEVRPRAYYNQAVWKRVVTIAAGPAVNILIAFAIVWGLLAANGQTSSTANTKVAAIERSSAAAQVLKVGDRIVSVDGARGRRIRHDGDQPRLTTPLRRSAGRRMRRCDARQLACEARRTAHPPVGPASLQRRSSADADRL